MMKLDEAMRLNKGIGPGFHLLRHALSFAILAGHCQAAIHGTGKEVRAAVVKSMGRSDEGLFAWLRSLSSHELMAEMVRPLMFSWVGMFFALSGFLVIGSAYRTASVRNFFVARFMRIVPALSMEVTLAALVLGPLLTVLPLNAYFTDPQFFRYFGNIIGEVTFRLPGLFLSNPWSGIVNASLWTLPAELWCYAILIGLMAARVVYKKTALSYIIVVATVAVTIASFVNPDLFTVRAENSHYTAWYLVFMFAFGAFFFIHAERIPLRFDLFVLCGVLFFALIFLRVLGPLSGIPLTYCMVYIGMTRFAWFDRLVRQDLSYGIYLYGFPLTQAVICVLLPHLHIESRVLTFVVIFLPALIGTVIFAHCSWNWIEKPALSLRHHFLREPPPKVK
jgi:peptidoglycan/LPS O-acetylase OafA/YrhL